MIIYRKSVKYCKAIIISIVFKIKRTTIRNDIRSLSGAETSAKKTLIFFRIASTSCARIEVRRSHVLAERTSVKENSWRVLNPHRRHESPLKQRRRFHMLLNYAGNERRDAHPTERYIAGPCAAVTYTARPPCSRFLLVGHVYWQEVGRPFRSASRLLIKEKMNRNTESSLCFCELASRTLRHRRGLKFS